MNNVNVLNVFVYFLCQMIVKIPQFLTYFYFYLHDQFSQFLSCIIIALILCLLCAIFLDKN